MAKIEDILGKFKLGIHVPGIVKKYLGDSGEESAVADSGGLYQNSKATSYVNAIGQKLAAASPDPKFGYKFQIVKDPDVNAFALPNGSVFVTMGLLRILRNEAQLANVMGHEISHVTAEHSVNQMTFDVGAMGGTELITRVGQALAGKKAVSNDDRKAAGALTTAVLSNGYSRDNENEADDLGQRLASKAGWDPSGMTDTMTILKAISGESPKGLERYLQDHPQAPARYTAAQKRAATLPPGELGEDRYKAFLASLGMQSGEIAKSPVAAAPAWLGRPGAALTSSSGPELWIGIGALAVGVAFIGWVLLRKKD